MQYQNTNGNYAFSTRQTAPPYLNDNLVLGSGSVGFGYASFLMGLTSGLTISDKSDTRLGNHSLAFYVQDEAPGSIRELKLLAEEAENFARSGCRILCVSFDDIKSHKQLSEQHGRPGPEERRAAGGEAEEEELENAGEDGDVAEAGGEGRELAE